MSEVRILSNSSAFEAFCFRIRRAVAVAGITLAGLGVVQAENVLSQQIESNYCAEVAKVSDPNPLSIGVCAVNGLVEATTAAMLDSATTNPLTPLRDIADWLVPGGPQPYFDPGARTK